MAPGIKITGRFLEILQVEDNDGDARLLKQALKKAGFPNRLNSVASGEAAWDYLTQKHPYQAALRPDVILLDLKLPGKDGLTVLNEIRQSEAFKNIPVIVLTSSESDLDQNWASRLNANHYLAKPYDYEGFAELIKLLREQWMKTFRKRRP